MASNVIVIAGECNSGKSTSFKYLNPENTVIISCTNKQLQIPGFRKKYHRMTVENGKLVGNWLVSNNYEQITKMLQAVSKTRPDVTTIIIDDVNYLMSNEIMQNALTKGYEKFTTQAKNYYDMFSTAQNLRDDLTVVIVSHIVNDGTDMDPHYKLYSSGKYNLPV